MKIILCMLLALFCMFSFSPDSFAAAQPDLAGTMTVSNPEESTSGEKCTTGMVARDDSIILAANCIEKGLTCILHGTPCCAPSECKGKFPNTYCQ